jgi:zinc and cadmium transporter
MEPVLLYAVAAVILVSLISLIGVITLWIKKELLGKIVFILVAFGAGTLFGAAFFHILPEAIEMMEATALTYVLGGIILFFFIERFIQWHHCHKLASGHQCDVKSYTYMNLIGDGVHNFTDGAIIMAAFLINIPIGIITTIAIMLHEIPQEISDFGILVKGGFGRTKALLYNLLSGLVAIVGTVTMYMFAGFIESSIPILIAIGAGSFIYIASTDLLPEMHKEMGSKKLVLQFAFLLLGIFLMWYLVGNMPHMHI